MNGGHYTVLQLLARAPTGGVSYSTMAIACLPAELGAVGTTLRVFAARSSTLLETRHSASAGEQGHASILLFIIHQYSRDTAGIQHDNTSSMGLEQGNKAKDWIALKR